MDQILIYGDSLTWGLIPGTRERLPFDQRWSGVFENVLHSEKIDVRVMENCINGRRTVWSDPLKEGRDGTQGLAQVIEMHSPLKLVILMLGTNDFQAAHQNDSWHSAQGTARLVSIIRQAPIEPGMPVPQIMIVAPPAIKPPKGLIAPKFKGAEVRWNGLNLELEKVAAELNASYFDANTVIETSDIDGVHLDSSQHQILGNAIAKAVIENQILI